MATEHLLTTQERLLKETAKSRPVSVLIALKQSQFLKSTLLLEAAISGSNLIIGRKLLLLLLMTSSLIPLKSRFNASALLQRILYPSTNLTEMIPTLFFRQQLSLKVLPRASPLSHTI